MAKSNTAKGDIVNEAVPEMNKVERTMKFDENNINLDRAVLDFDGLQHGMNRGGDKLGSKKRRDEFFKQEQLQSGHISNKKMNVIYGWGRKYYHSRQYQWCQWLNKWLKQILEGN